MFSTILPQAAGGDRAAWDREIDWISELSRETGLRVTFPLGASTDGSDMWRSVLPGIEAENADGARIVPQVGCHRQGLLCGLRTTHIFRGRPSYDAIARSPARRTGAAHGRPRGEGGDPRRAARARHAASCASCASSETTAVFPSAPLPDQEPDPATSLAAQAAATGRDPEELLYDWTIADDGEALVHYFLGGYPGNLDASLELMSHPDSVLGLGDGGAHVDIICDAGYPSFVLVVLGTRPRPAARSRSRRAIEILTSEPATLFGLDDRGVRRGRQEGRPQRARRRRIEPLPLEIVHDLPAGAKRIVQHADGFVVTIVSGEVVQRDGVDTGARPGRTVRSVPA